MNLEKVYKYIDDQTRIFIEDLTKLVRQPSVSAKGEGIEECAILVEEMMREIGVSTRILREKREIPSFTEKLSQKNRVRLLSSMTITMCNHQNLLRNGCMSRSVAK